MKNTFTTLAASCSLLLVAASSFAQAPVKQHRSLMDILRHRHPGSTATGTMGSTSNGYHGMSSSAMGRPHMGMSGSRMGGMHIGNIVGNRNTHVYHLPGDRGQLPSPQNRVYFSTSAQAEAAGYHRAGGSSKGGHMMMHGHPGMMHHSTGSFGMHHM